MSAPSARVVKSPRAEADLEDIFVESALRWGEGHALTYSDLIAAALTRLGAFPAMGRPRGDLFAGCRSLSVEQHVIFYRIDGQIVRISRILFKRMNPRAHVTGNE